MDRETLLQRLSRAIGASRSLVADSREFQRQARDFNRDPKRLRNAESIDDALLAKLKRDAGERKR